MGSTELSGSSELAREAERFQGGWAAHRDDGVFYISPILKVEVTHQFMVYVKTSWVMFKCISPFGGFESWHLWEHEGGFSLDYERFTLAQCESGVYYFRGTGTCGQCRFGWLYPKDFEGVRNTFGLTNEAMETLLHPPKTVRRGRPPKPPIVG